MIVNARNYETVIGALGNKRTNINACYPGGYAEMAGQVARRYSSREYYQVGPAANLDFSRSEYDAGYTLDRAGGDASKDAIFRLAPRTAALAAMLPTGPMSG